MTRAFIIGGHVYEVQSPSIKKISSATEALGEITQNETIEGLLNGKSKETLANVLSMLHKGNNSLSKEFSKADKQELVEALNTMYEDVLTSFRGLSKISNYLSNLSAKSI